MKMIQRLRSGFASLGHARGLMAPCVVVTSMMGIVRASPLDFPPQSVDAAADASGPAETDADDAIATPRRVPRLIALVGVDTPGDPGVPSPTAGDSPTESSGPFDATRDDLGEDDDLSMRSRKRRRGGFAKPADVDKLPDPLRGTPLVSPQQTGADAEKMLQKMLRPRSDSWSDWSAGIEPLHFCGEPRWLPPCVPPPPCHPSQPPRPYDLVGARGEPTDGPIYPGPCEPRTGTHDDCPHPHLHRLHDRLFDLFYMWK